jgi:hypothetical protein
MSGKGKAPKDWRQPNSKEDTLPEVLAQLWLPFHITPEQIDTVPKEYQGEAQHYSAGVEGAPYARYYVNYHRALLSVTNVYGY